MCVFWPFHGTLKGTWGCPGKQGQRAPFRWDLTLVIALCLNVVSSMCILQFSGDSQKVNASREEALELVILSEAVVVAWHVRPLSLVLCSHRTNPGTFQNEMG